MDKMSVGTFNKLLAELKKGDGVAFDKFYRHFLPKIVRNITTNKFGDESFAMDVVHEFFYKLITRVKDDDVKYPTAWTLGVCRNIAKNMIKKRKREMTLYENEDDVFENIAVYDTPNLDGVFGDLTKYVNKLDERERKILTMREVFGYAYTEIAEILGISYGNVRQIHYRICKKLKKYVTK